MNYKFLIIRSIYEDEILSQRDLSRKYDCSLGKVNLLLQELLLDGYLEKKERYKVTEKGKSYLKKYKVDKAIILAAGIGSRLVPLTYDTPKGLLKVHGERMIERQIKQLHKRHIKDITIVVGYLKEKFDYLIDEYDVKIVYNPEYNIKNNISSMFYANDFYVDSNVYILASDNYMSENIFHEYECEPWYASVYMEGKTKEWQLITNSKKEITEVIIGGENCNVMYGPTFFNKDFSIQFSAYVKKYYNIPGTENFFWEDIFMRCIKYLPPMYAYIMPKDIVYEFESLEELRQFDKSYENESGSMSMNLVAKTFGVKEKSIIDIECIKKGMTNRSWRFSIKKKNGETNRFICRVPGDGTQKLINRHQEKIIYDTLSIVNKKLIEDVKYFDEESGVKISTCYENARTATTSNEDMRNVMRILRKLHNQEIKVDFDFDIEKTIEYYENLITSEGKEILFYDYLDIKREAFEVLRKIKSFDRPITLCHIDSNVDNILFTNEGIKLIDWEYASMQDPLIDIAMCAIYSFLNFDDVDRLLDFYNEDAFSPNIAMENISYEKAKMLIIAYMGLGGFVWSIWALYKNIQGQDFGEYSLKNYRYFKNSYKYLREKKFFRM